MIFETRVLTFSTSSGHSGVNLPTGLKMENPQDLKKKQACSPKRVSHI